jgi:formyltetrahydrofolate deformylase
MIFHLTCVDQEGIIAQFTQLLFQHHVNVLSLEQHVEPDEGLFFMRTHADLRNMTISPNTLIDLLNEIENKLSGNLTIHDPLNRLNVAILCTKEQAHVSDLLMKYQSGELNCKIPLVISNHDNLRDLVERYGIAYHHLPLSIENKELQEKEILSLLKDENIDVVVLARYMQVLPPKIVHQFEGRIINIHHAFLPAFKGNRPYRKAWIRGVKMIGATAHYVTEDLDEGPIIEQDVESVTHQHSVKEMIQAGRDIERRVLTSAVKAHLQHRILLHGQRTLIFHS